MIYYTEKEIKEEIDKGKIIILSEGKVYDVTDFADRHPGGREHLVKQVGNDVTQQMESETPHHHSLAAYTILKKYCIGNLMQVGDMQYCIWLNYICYVTSEVKMYSSGNMSCEIYMHDVLLDHVACLQVG